MLIKLIPDSPNPAVLFALTFANAPFAYSPDSPHASVPDEVSAENSLFMSPGWANQLNALAIDDLDAPTALHALDRAAGIPTLIQEVTLDVPSNTVRCLFIDGAVEEWMWPINPQIPVPVDKCSRLQHGMAPLRCYFEMLQSIVRDVNQSAMEEERERQRELYLVQQQQEQQHRRSLEASVPLPRPPLKSHKKQRSFFMNFVASIVNLTPVSSSHSNSRIPPPLSLIMSPSSPKLSPITVSLPLSPTPPPTPTLIKSPFPPLWSPPNSPMRQTLRQLEPPASASRMLRWRARSSLVDIFRRFVLPEIIIRSPYGSYRNYHAININYCGSDGIGKVGAGYYLWTIESVLRRAGHRMDELTRMAVVTRPTMERERDRRIKTKIFPRFSVPRRKLNQAQGSIQSVAGSIHARRSAEEDKVQWERERREAEYFASTTQSVQSPHLFSDEEEDPTEIGKDSRQRLFSQRRDSDIIINEDEDADSIETDTDGSSVHTPSSGHETSVFLPSSRIPGNPTKPPPPPRHTRGTPRIVQPTPVRPRLPTATLISECPPPGSLPPTEMAEYKTLARLTGKLQHLLIGARSRAAQAESETRQREALLEVRSRRRAWLNRALGSCAPTTGVKDQLYDGNVPYGYIATCIMSTPYSSSPLARSVQTSEDWEYCPDAYVEEDDDFILQGRVRFTVSDDADHVGIGHQLRRVIPGWGAKARGEPRLFPVTEEEEDEPVLNIVSGSDRRSDDVLIGMGMGDDDDLRELELGLAGFGLDLEGGEMVWMENESGEHNAAGGVRIALEPERPRIRARTSSMYEQKSPFGRLQNQQPLVDRTGLQFDQKMASSDVTSGPPGLTASSLLCQPLTTDRPDDGGKNSKAHAAVFTPPASSGPLEKPLICESFIGEIKDSGEFTLSMDLPPPRRARSPPSVFGNVPSVPPLSILSPSPQNGSQVQLSAVPDAR
ncbi:hypothetical protein AX15_000950 [Amanita polypyramis BW_CC]|nr:hypothetical protein AX15_000950 [Amanita polypyramis BW_CC]